MRITRDEIILGLPALEARRGAPALNLVDGRLESVPHKVVFPK